MIENSQGFFCIFSVTKSRKIHTFIIENGQGFFGVFLGFFSFYRNKIRWTKTICYDNMIRWVVGVFSKKCPKKCPKFCPSKMDPKNYAVAF